jgi:hypothetical protein
MSHTTHYKISLIGALISSIAFTALSVFAIAPGETLDPIGDNLCATVNDPACVINPYEDLDANGILYLDDNGDIATDELFFRSEDLFFVGTETLNPGYLTGISIDDALGNGFFIGSQMVHYSQSSDSFNLVFNGDATNVGMSDQTTFVGYLDFNNNYHAFSSFQPGVINTILRMEDSFGDEVENSFTMIDGGILLEAKNETTGNESRMYLTPSSGITFDFDGVSGYTFPRADGDLGEVLTTDGAGVLSWQTPSGGNGSPAGNNTEIQFNNNGNFSASSDFVFGANIFNVQRQPVSGYTSSVSIGDQLFGGLVSGTSLLHTNGSGNNYVFVGDGSGINSPANFTSIGYLDQANGVFSRLNAEPDQVKLAYDLGLVSNQLFINDTGVRVELYGDTPTSDFQILNSFTAAEIFSIKNDGVVRINNAFSLPTADGDPGQVLQTNGGGAVTWQTPSGGSSLFTLDLVANLFDSRAGNGTMTGNDNLFFGNGAGFANTTGSNNVFLGQNAGIWNTTGENNVFLGFLAGMNQQGNDNQIAIGAEALRGDAVPANNTGIQNTAVGYQAGYSNTSGSSNLFTGYQAGYSNTTGINNVFLGPYSGLNMQSASNNIAMGYYALRGSATPADNTGENNIAIGYQSGYSNTTGIRNLAIGTSSLYSNTTGVDNVALGYESLENNTIGQQNVAIGGYRSLYSNTEGSGNISLGYNLIANTTGSGNIALGVQALNSVETGFGSISIGQGSLFSATGSTNIAIGYGAADNITTGSNNIIIGYNIDAPSATGNDQLNIGDAILGDLSTGDISIASLISCGGIQTNGSGTMSCTSDETLKDIQGAFTKGLDAIRGINPSAFSWRIDSGLYDNGVIYNGFIAQNVQEYLPEAISISSNGKLQVSQLTLTATLVNAVKELDLKITGIQNLTNETFLSRIRNWFADAGNGIQRFFAKEIYTEQICVAKSDGTDFCVTGDELESVMNGVGNQIIHTSNNNNQNDSDDSDEQESEEDTFEPEQSQDTPDEGQTESELIINESSDNQIEEENNDPSSGSEVDVNGETDVDTGTDADESPSEDQPTENNTPTESSPGDDEGSDSSSESGDAGQDSGAESDSSIDE